MKKNKVFCHSNRQQLPLVNSLKEILQVYFTQDGGIQIKGVYGTIKIRGTHLDDRIKTIIKKDYIKQFYTDRCTCCGEPYSSFLDLSFFHKMQPGYWEIEINLV